MIRKPFLSTILLIEDDVSTAVPLTVGLQDQGFKALHATDGQQGLEYARAVQPNLVLLNAMLPQMDGFAVCCTLRRDSAVPIIMLAAHGGERDRVRGLEIGADDYVVEPYSFRELLARMRALLRRRELDRDQPSPPRDRIVAGDIVLDRAALQVWRDGHLVELRQREFDLLCVLMEYAGQAVPRHELLDHVWGEDWIGDPRTLDVHICWLRGKGCLTERMVASTTARMGLSSGRSRWRWMAALIERQRLVFSKHGHCSIVAILGVNSPPILPRRAE
jgi:DNA-binding response OmpR family regulator